MLEILFLVTAVILAIYALLILLYRHWFMSLEPFNSEQIANPITHFSIIIPARDEAANIEACLNSMLKQNYPTQLFEVIVINDHSTDETESIVKKMQEHFLNLRLLNLAAHLQDAHNSYKKKAIELAIGQSSGNWIITTDADCFAKPNWLSLYDTYIQTSSPVFIAAPVQLRNNGSFLSIFQVLDFMSLQGITAASVAAGTHAMCKGANLAYEKKAFYAVGQFSGIDNIASGDDMLLMQKIKKQYPGKLGFLFHPDAVVETLPMLAWNEFFQQRIRWASKAVHYQDKSIFWVLLLVYCANFLLFLMLCMGIYDTNYFYQFFELLLLKIVAELLFLYPVSKFFKQTRLLYLFPIMQPIHICYTVIAGWMGKFGSYQWKGRKVN